MRSNIFRITTIAFSITVTTLIALSAIWFSRQNKPPTFPISSIVSLPNMLPEQFKIGVIGDFGNDSSGELQVSQLIKSWEPGIIITTGDNNYTVGSADTIDTNIGKYFHEFIGNYRGNFGGGAVENKFFPSLGNHDWGNGSIQPYLDYFSLPGNERYYDFEYGPIHFFVLDSDPREYDGISVDSAQAQWLKVLMSNSTARWQVVYFHHPPYSSGADHGSTEIMRWLFADWGADLVLSGHEHFYERLEAEGIPYIINGAGGANLYKFATPLAESRFRYNANFGAQLIEATDCELQIKFYAVGNSIPEDQLTLNHSDCN